MYQTITDAFTFSQRLLDKKENISERRNAVSKFFMSFIENRIVCVTDVSGLAKVRQIVTGACRKCGFPGHLPFQCRNYIQLKPGQSTVIDVSSTSSESETETPLGKLKKHKKKHKKKDSKKEKKEKKDKKKKKEKKRRRHSSFELDTFQIRVDVF
ncbi:unnamed protein product [Heligmosomoides polygyrus]|uniref:Mediator of RNA polymerase II transcription subunit 19 n=1 Tax=Heligmosomoides polygyrus TaxID=6339 RepID=A0A3P7Y1M6_HELPZ|nr:unnamed protein product [Heligmosomoides polygyrus]